MGSAIFEAIGYRDTTDFMTVVCLGYSLAFFLFNVGCRVFAQEKQIHKRMEEARREQTSSDEGELRIVEQEIMKKSSIKFEPREETMEDFLQRKREQWGSQGGRVNNLSTLLESKRENTEFKDSTVQNKYDLHDTKLSDSQV